MLSITRQIIDNIFNPRVPVNLGVRPTSNRLLVDASGRFQFIDGNGVLYLLQTSHWLEPRKHYAVWCPVEAQPVEPLWECLPGPCSP